jgi:signal transduction histidine kinase
VAAQFAGYQAALEFETRLARYHAIHRLREAFSRHVDSLERRFREGVPPTPELLGQELLSLWVEYAAAEGARQESLEAFFNVNATRWGMEAYGRAAESAARRWIGVRAEYYSDLASAIRIGGYVDDYLSRLLSASLEEGERIYETVSRRNATLRVLTFAGLGFFAVLFAAFAVVFSGSVARPIRRLAEAAERMAAGDLAVEEVPAATGDEVETLARSFNAMSRSLRTMVDDLKEKAELERKLREEERELMETEKALKEAQYMSLQDQIRPHFLFNALNTIARTALFEEAAETERLTHALGRLLRYSMGAAESVVPVRDEVAVLREYLEFQALRFGKRLTWDISVDKGAEELPIPRFTLQPLVENAVRHGIEPLENGGTVRVRVHRRNGRVLMSVEDSGVGMPRATARALLAGDGAGIGLSNVAKRLSLRYGGAERISVRSEPGAGTIIRISFPAAEGAPT